MRDPGRSVVVTGMGVCCHLGDDLSQIESMLRQGRAPAFVHHPPSVEAGARCQIFGPYRGELALPRQEARFMGRAAQMACKAAMAALYLRAAGASNFFQQATRAHSRKRSMSQV